MNRGGVPAARVSRSKAAFGALAVACAAVGGCTPAVSVSDAGDAASTADGGVGVVDGGACSRLGSTRDAGYLEAGDVVSASAAPPPLSGGTLLVTRDTHYAVASDPDRDRVVVVDLSAGTGVHPVDLAAGDEPGRLVEDAAGRVHIALRAGGAVVTVDPASATVVERRAVCSAPRGIAYEPGADVVHVACAGGELVTLPAAGGPATRTLMLDRDLRDVVVDNGRLLVSRFRSAEVMVVGADGTMLTRFRAPARDREMTAGGTAHFDAEVAWRMVPAPAGGALMLHQRAVSSPVVPPPASQSYYNTNQFLDGCAQGLVNHAVSAVSASGATDGLMLDSGASLAIDLALSRDGSTAAVVSAGYSSSQLPRVTVYPLASLTAGGCATQSTAVPITPEGRITAVTFVGDGHSRLAVQTREPAAVTLVDWTGGASQTTTYPLPGDSRYDTGDELFHTPLAGSLTCAECHPEAGDDGHTWQFPCDGPRRSQPLRGGLLATAPFHWDGRFATFQDLADDVFVERLGADRPTPEQTLALAHWLDSQPAPRPSSPADPAAVARGEALFNDATVACASCHSGPEFTNNQTVDVGTGGSFQVPTLVGISLRGPFLHDGCAPTLRDRFGACGGGDRHGHTSQLSAAQVGDLVAYLESL